MGGYYGKEEDAPVSTGLERFNLVCYGGSADYTEIQKSREEKESAPAEKSPKEKSSAEKSKESSSRRRKRPEEKSPSEKAGKRADSWNQNTKTGEVQRG